jgi:hypothetical protein
MRIYFTTSPRGKKLYKKNCKKIHELIEELGHKNLDDLSFKSSPKKFISPNQADQINFYKRTMNSIKKAEIVVLEVSKPNLDLGYIINRALAEGKPVVALHLEGAFPYFLGGIEDEKLQVLSYTPEKIRQLLKNTFEYAKEQMDVRFNFFISPRIGHYLDWIARHKKLPRAVFLRKLIEEHMKKNKEYRA